MASTLQTSNIPLNRVPFDQVAHTDITLDDLWGVDLAKLDGWKCIQPNTAGEDVFAEDPDWETDESETDDK